MKIIKLDVTPQFIGETIIPVEWPHRKWWYPITERDKERTSIDKSLIGKLVLVDKIIVRVGYFFQPTDVDYYHIRETVDEILKQQLSKVFGGVLPDTSVNISSNLKDVFGYGIINSALYRARKLWMEKAYQIERYKSYRHVRTFWYVNLKDVDPESVKWLRIDKIQRHMVGLHYPPSGGGDYDDYEPGGLYESQHQTVYVANQEYQQVVCRNYDDYWDGTVKIHPLDILEIK